MSESCHPLHSKKDLWIHSMASPGNLLFMDSMTEYSHEVTVGCMHIWVFEYTQVNIERADRRIWFFSMESNFFGDI